MKVNVYLSIQSHRKGFCDPVRKPPDASFDAGIEGVSVHIFGE